MVSKFGEGPHAIWIDADILAEQEIAESRAFSGIDLTIFRHPLPPSDPDKVGDELATIEQHHSGATILIESCRTGEKVFRPEVTQKNPGLDVIQTGILSCSN